LLTILCCEKKVNGLFKGILTIYSAKKSVFDCC